jgi:hypothetical protein
VLVVPRHDPGRGVRLDPCTAMCGYTPSFTKQSIRWNSSSEHVRRLALSSILNLCTRSQLGIQLQDEGVMSIAPNLRVPSLPLVVGHTQAKMVRKAWQKRAYSTSDSHVVPHRSTDKA